ncbi:MAG: MFS transporter, partial [Thermovirgaceae bacterium]|nr:MFS transporter [Thermovirgaceae bacterium]
LVGLAIGITRVWDAFLDPVMGAISDSTRSRFGRRKPYLLSGALVAGILFGLMWQVPLGLSATSYFIFLTVCLILFYTGFTVFTVPYHALGYEMTADYHDRTGVMSYRMLFNMVGNICAGWLLAATQHDIFDNMLQGARFVGPATGLIFILCGIAPVIFVKERFHQPAPTIGEKKLSIVISLLATLKDKAFQVFIALTILMLGGWTFATSIIVFINVSYVFPGDLKTSSILVGTMVVVQTVSAAVALPLATRLSRKFGKIGILKFSFSLQFLHAFSAWFLITPAYPYLQLVAYVFGAVANVTYYLMLHSVTSDICDADELSNGTRREGMYGAVITWIQKLSVSVAIALVGVALVAAGFDQTEGAIQSYSTGLSLRLIYCGIFFVIGVAGLLLLPRFKLTEKHVLEIQAILEQRKSEKN